MKIKVSCPILFTHCIVFSFQRTYLTDYEEGKKHFVANPCINGKCKCAFKYSQTWVNNHLRIAAPYKQRPPYRGSIFNIYNIMQPLNNDHLSTTATCQQRPQIWGPEGCRCTHRFDCGWWAKMYDLLFWLKNRCGLRKTRRRRQERPTTVDVSVASKH